MKNQEKFLLEECYSDYSRCSKDSSVSDTWLHTGANNIDYFKTNSLENLSINSNLKALAHIDSYPSTSFLNDDTSELLKLQSYEKLKFYKKIELNKKKISPSHMIHYRNFLEIKKYIKLNSNVLEIGSGSGILSSMIHRSFKTKNFMCDIPETLIFQKYYIKKNFKNIKTQFIANSTDKINLNNDFFFINSSQLLRLKLDLDLVINIDSFSEMDKNTVINYLDYSEKKLKKNGTIFLSNTIGHSKNGFHYPSEIPIPKLFKVDDLDIYYPTARDNYSKYLNIVLKKISIRRKFNANKKLLKSFYLNSDDIIYQNSYAIYKKKFIDVFNQYDNSKKYIKIKPKVFKFDYSQNFNVEKLYLYLFKKIINFLKNNQIDKIKDLYSSLYKREFKNTKLQNDISVISKLILLSKLSSQKIDKRYLDLISVNSFEGIFIKFNLINKNLKLQNFYLKKLIKISNLHYFEILKVYYCAVKINNIDIKKKIQKKIMDKAKNKLSIMYYLKLLILLGDVEEFIIKYKYFSKKKIINLSDVLSDLVSINAIEKKESIKAYKLINKNINLVLIDSLKNELDLKIIQLKSLILKEEDFFNFLKEKYWNDYYNLGYVLKNTLNFMEKKNIELIAKQSLKLRNNLINKLFIADIYFFNFMKKQTLDIFSKIDNIEDLNIYYLLKKTIANRLTNLEIKNLIKNDFFKIFNSGFLSFIPFLNSGNNQVQLTNIKILKIDNKI